MSSLSYKEEDPTNRCDRPRLVPINKDLLCIYYVLLCTTKTTMYQHTFVHSSFMHRRRNICPLLLDLNGRHSYLDFVPHSRTLDGYVSPPRLYPPHLLPSTGNNRRTSERTDGYNRSKRSWYQQAPSMTQFRGLTPSPSPTNSKAYANVNAPPSTETSSDPTKRS